MDFSTDRHIGDILKDRNIILTGSRRRDPQGFTQVPNFILRIEEDHLGDKMTFAMILSYTWQNDYCFPGQATLGEDMGVDDRTVRATSKRCRRQVCW